MTIVISQLYLMGFNATCDFEKSQFADGLSCISLQQSHDLSIYSRMCLQIELALCNWRCTQNDCSQTNASKQMKQVYRSIDRIEFEKEKKTPKQSHCS